MCDHALTLFNLKFYILLEKISQHHIEIQKLEKINRKFLIANLIELDRDPSRFIKKIPSTNK